MRVLVLDALQRFACGFAFFFFCFSVLLDVRYSLFFGLNFGNPITTAAGMPRVGS